MKKSICLIAVICLLFSLCACGTPTTIPSPSPTVTAEPEPTQDPMEEYLEYLDDAYSPSHDTLNYILDQSGNTITLTISNPNTDKLSDSLSDDFFEYSQQWESIVSSIKKLSHSIVNDAKIRGLEVVGVTNLVRCDNRDSVLCSAKNGEVTYNIADEIPESKIVFHEPSMYKVGADLEAGEYYVLPIESDQSVYVCVTSDSNGDDILDNSFQEGPHYITVSDGQYLTVEHGRFALASEFAAHPKDYIGGEGMYLVGKDIVAGEYKLTSDGEASGYYCIYAVSSADRRIVNNSLFDNAAYVTVSDGQYLLVSSCSGTLVQ